MLRSVASLLSARIRAPRRRLHSLAKQQRAFKKPGRWASPSLRRLPLRAQRFRLYDGGQSVPHWFSFWFSFLVRNCSWLEGRICRLPTSGPSAPSGKLGPQEAGSACRTSSRSSAMPRICGASSRPYCGSGPSQRACHCTRQPPSLQESTGPSGRSHSWETHSFQQTECLALMLTRCTES